MERRGAPHWSEWTSLFASGVVLPGNEKVISLFEAISLAGASLVPGWSGRELDARDRPRMGSLIAATAVELGFFAAGSRSKILELSDELVAEEADWNRFECAVSIVRQMLFEGSVVAFSVPVPPTMRRSLLPDFWQQERASEAFVTGMIMVEEGHHGDVQVAAAVPVVVLEREVSAAVEMLQQVSATSKSAHQTAAKTGADRAGTKRNKPGRRPRSSPYADQDAQLVAEMQELIHNRDAASPHEAAMKVADKAPGGGSLSSKVDRLRKKYIERYHSNSLQ